MQVAAHRPDLDVARATRELDEEAAFPRRAGARGRGGDPLSAGVVAHAPVDVAAVLGDVEEIFK